LEIDAVDSHFKHLAEQVEALSKTQEGDQADHSLTASQLEEIRTTGVILDPYLQAKIEEARQKLSVAQPELNSNETRLRELELKISSAVVREKQQEEESEQMYTDVEVMCQAKEAMIEEIKSLALKKVVLKSNLSKSELLSQQVQESLSKRQKYLYDV
jgi:hypothetical protein